MVDFIRDKQVNNYRLFTGEEDFKMVLRNLHFNLDDIDSRMARVEKYIVSNSDTELVEDHADEHEALEVINNVPLVVESSTAPSPQ